MCLRGHGSSKGGSFSVHPPFVTSSMYVMKTVFNYASNLCFGVVFCFMLALAFDCSESLQSLSHNSPIACLNPLRLTAYANNVIATQKTTKVSQLPQIAITNLEMELSAHQSLRVLL